MHSAAVFKSVNAVRTIASRISFLSSLSVVELACGADLFAKLFSELNFISFVDNRRLPRPGSSNARYCLGVRAPGKG